jgi:hypothetical protein
VVGENADDGVRSIRSILMNKSVLALLEGGRKGEKDMEQKNKILGE